MNAPDEPVRLERRVAIKWMLTAAAAVPLLDRLTFDAEAAEAGKATGYGPDPDRLRSYRPGELWPLTFTSAERRAAVALCDVIMPADESSPSAAAVGVPDFIDEWISSPYPAQSGEGNEFRRSARAGGETTDDRAVIVRGLEWIDAEAQRRFQAAFADLKPAQQTAICDDICNPTAAKPEHRSYVPFFKRFRDLTTGGYYTTPEGMKAIGYTGNVALTSFDGPSPAVLKQLGLTGEHP
ncbi:MAG: gluconate 2-dehydrogenase subunit 3 family protein [Opitutus sp.]|nr:gluconate 2-dehydrogenase subunit 3 family protein [Opitutus sp.]